VHPDETVASVRAATGFDFDVPALVPTTEPPGAAEIALLDGPVADAIAEVYPRFAGAVFEPTGTP
jgi:glutaconate CoA-transferase subunit B